jgi:hypothetical protein
MFNRIHQKLGTAGFIISIVALVAALGGGAYAASGGLNGKQKKEVEKIAKKFAGKPGTNGTNGSNGSPGAKGDAGAAGGAGAAGQSVTGTPIAVGSTECTAKAGGVKYTSASGTNAVCNGKDGTTGFTSTLPAGKTETGVWAFGPAGAPGGTLKVPVASFNIPLAAPLSGEGCGTVEPGPPAHVAATCKVHYINALGKEEVENTGTEAFEELTPTGCPGSAAAPQAESGNLCVYAREEVPPAVGPVSTSEQIRNAGSPGGGAATTGAIEFFNVGNGTTVSAYGTWAVTG